MTTPQVVADPKKPYKAYVATALTVVSTFVVLWIADTDPFTAKEAAGDFVQALVAGGIVGVPTFAVRNPKIVKN